MEQELKGSIVQIQHFSVNDGDGIRSTIFLSGCPLRCKWCSNPESWSTEPSEHVKRLTLKDIEAEIKRHLVFYRYSEGGVTYSGGEPTYQSAFLRSMVSRFYNMGIHQAIETSGYFDFEEVRDIFENLDLLFIDIKHMDRVVHKEMTGVSNNIILDNIKALAKLNKDLIIRIPLIKGINDDEENIRNTAEFVKENVIKGMIELLPYHSLGNYKYDVLGYEYAKHIFETPSKDEINRTKDIIGTYGVEVVEYR